jgi:hypothetical protein
VRTGITSASNHFLKLQQGDAGDWEVSKECAVSRFAGQNGRIKNCNSIQETQRRALGPWAPSEHHLGLLRVLLWALGREAPLEEEKAHAFSWCIGMSRQQIRPIVGPKCLPGLHGFYRPAVAYKSLKLASYVMGDRNREITIFC